MTFAHRFILLTVLVLTANAAAEDIPRFTDEGFAVPQPEEQLSFPTDHGSHPDYKIEWWYLTGHMETEGGREFGFQATFFRSALRPPAEQGSDGSDPTVGFGRDHLFLAHMALTDVAGGRFLHEERFNRDGWNATAAVDELAVRNGNWTLAGKPDDDGMVLQLEFTATDAAAVSLTLRPEKPLIRFGADGTSRKGAAPAARSFYLTWPRLAAEGTVRLGEETNAVTGRVWMDHEIASQQLSNDLAGWDWTAVQLEDGWDLKAYILRRPDGSADPFSALMWIDPEGNVVYRAADEFSWERVRWWTSPETGARYPVEVKLTTIDPRTGEPTSLFLRPVLDAQELSTSSAGFPYWEGAGRVESANGEILGKSYLELVGYGGGGVRGLR